MECRNSTQELRSVSAGLVFADTAYAQELELIVGAAYGHVEQ